MTRVSDYNMNYMTQFASAIRCCLLAVNRFAVKLFKDTVCCPISYSHNVIPCMKAAVEAARGLSNGVGTEGFSDSRKLGIHPPSYGGLANWAECFHN